MNGEEVDRDRANNKAGTTDEVLEALRQLRMHDLKHSIVERVRGESHRVLQQSTEKRRKQLEAARRAYHRAEPVLVGAVALAYLLVTAQLLAVR